MRAFSGERKCKHCNKLHSNSVCSPDMKTPGSYDRRIVPSIIRGRIIGCVLVLCCKTARYIQPALQTATKSRSCQRCIIPGRDFQTGQIGRVCLEGWIWGAWHTLKSWWPDSGWLLAPRVKLDISLGFHWKVISLKAGASFSKNNFSQPVSTSHLNSLELGLCQETGFKTHIVSTHLSQIHTCSV